MKAPKTLFIRTGAGRPAEIVPSQERDFRGALLYRLWYGDIMGNGLFTLQQLEAVPGVQWLESRPEDLAEQPSDA